MQSVKKILPYLLIAVVFLVGGYLIGQNSTKNQEASIYATGLSSLKSTQVGTVSTGGGAAYLISRVGNTCWLFNGHGDLLMTLDPFLCGLAVKPISTPSTKIDTTKTTQVGTINVSTGGGAAYLISRVGNTCWLFNGHGDLLMTLDPFLCGLSVKPATTEIAK
jgi:lipoate-protein ligase A